MALISAKRYGNWTRFINHSCDSSTVFRLRTIGGRERVMVEAVRDIDVFEEVSVDYGAKYWGNGRFCECGLEGCAFSREKSEAI